MKGWAFVVLAAGALLQSPQPLRVSVDGVRVDVLVTDGRRPVPGLTAADFELRDSGVVQRIDAVAFGDVPLRVMLALDASSSVRGAPLEHLKQAALTVAGLLAARDRAALVTFSEEVDLACGWTSDRQALERAVRATTVSGSTSLHDAAYAALLMEDPQPGRPLVIVFTDGDDSTSWLPAATVLDAARRRDAVVYIVSLRTTAARRPGYLIDFRSGPQREMPRALPAALGRPFTAALAEETGGRLIDLDASQRLRDTFAQIVEEFRSRYLLSYSPAGVPASGWHPIEVKLRRGGGQVTARRGYLR